MTNTQLNSKAAAPACTLLSTSLLLPVEVAFLIGNWKCDWIELSIC